MNTTVKNRVIKSTIKKIEALGFSYSVEARATGETLTIHGKDDRHFIRIMSITDEHATYYNRMVQFDGVWNGQFSPSGLDWAIEKIF